MRNRPELALMRRLVEQGHDWSTLKVTVVACSKGAEVYSIAWALASARPGVKLELHAVDISREILEFAERGAYSLKSLDGPGAPALPGFGDEGDVTRNTCRDQNAPIFERMTREEVAAMCEVEGERATIRPWLREGITWLHGDAGDSALAGVLGPQDIVVANRFLCHMSPASAEACLRKVAGLVKPGGYLFVSGVDLDVRTRVAREMGWNPVPDLMKEVHEGDTSLRCGWPLEYWGLEPFSDTRSDWNIRYASVFQIGCASGSPNRRQTVAA